MSDSQVAIVGAGPYGLSVAAHLRRLGVGFRVFGVPMYSWRKAMPAGMLLKSDGMGSNLSDPEDRLTLARYCSDRGLPYGNHGVPIPLQIFVDYGLSFQQQLVPGVEECAVLDLAGKAGQFELQLSTGESVAARSVVLAVGTSNFAYRPPQFVNFPPELVTHSSNHSNLTSFRGKEVIVVGGGQAALETAALLHEQGASVQVLVRAPLVEWNPHPSPSKGVSSLCPLQTALGEGWNAWFYCHMQRTFRHLPLPMRARIVKHALGPAGAWWLRDRVLGRFPVLCGHEVMTAREEGGRVSLSVALAGGGSRRISADHVIAATGYKVDVDSLPFLSADLSRSLQREGALPVLSRDFESSLRGLYFTGLASAHRFGPSMRFVYGAEFAAPRIARSLMSDGGASVYGGWPQKRESQSVQPAPTDRPSLPENQVGASARIEASVPALVLNFGEYPFHQGSLGVTRSLGRLGVPVYAVQRNRTIPSGTSRYLRGKFLWKTDRQEGNWFIEGMKMIARDLSHGAVLVPADDLSAILIAEHAEEMPAGFRFAQPPAVLPQQLANKRSLHDLCCHLGVPCPSAEFPSTCDELRHLARSSPLPVVVKVVEPWKAPRGFKSTVIISERLHLMDYCEDFARQDSNTTLMLQEMIPASSSEDWFVHGYCDQHGNPDAIFTGIKLRSYPVFAGPTTFARAVRNDALRDQTMGLLKGIGYRGIMDLDFRFDRRDARYKLVDFNPRIGAQFRIFQTADGTDVVRALYRDLTGQGLCHGEQLEGRTFIAEIQDLFASVAYWRRGALTLKNWWTSIRRIDETAWFAASDPLPFLVMCLRLPFRALMRALSFSRRSQVDNTLQSPLSIDDEDPVANGPREIPFHFK